MFALLTHKITNARRFVLSRVTLAGVLKLVAADVLLSLVIVSCALPEKPFTVSPPTTPLTLESVGNVDSALFPADGVLLTEEESEMGMQSGLRPKFSVTAGVIADDNLYLDPTNEVSDVEFTVSPHVAIGVGDTREFSEDYALLDYTPTGHLFVETSDLNAVDHDAALKLQRSLGKLRTRAEGRFQSLSGANREVGSRIDQKAYQSTVEGAYAATGKIQVGGRAGFRNDEYDDAVLANTSDRYVEGFADYALTGKTTVGAGGRAGMIETDGASDQDYSQVFVRGESKIGGKAALSARAGVDQRDVEGTSEVNPILEAALSYAPRAGTQLQVSPYQALSASTVNPGESYIRTGVNASIKQKLGARFYAKLDGGYEKADYNATVTPTGTQKREDDYFYIRPAVGYEFKEGLSAEMYYRRSTNDSSNPEFSYDANQVGAGVSIQY